MSNAKIILDTNVVFYLLKKSECAPPYVGGRQNGLVEDGSLRSSPCHLTNYDREADLLHGWRIGYILLLENPTPNTTENLSPEHVPYRQKLLP